MRRIFFTFVIAMFSFGFSISADADGLSGRLIAIPGYTGSGVSSCVDLSSAVLLSKDEEGEIIIAANVRNITRSGEEFGNELWFFRYSEQDGHVYVKSERGNGEYDINSPLPFPGHQEYVEAFFENLKTAAETNE